MSDPSIPERATDMKIMGSFDGLIRSRGKGQPHNPGGVGCYGWNLWAEGRKIAFGYGYLGEGDGMTVNVAEYGGLIALLEGVRDIGLSEYEVSVMGDSQVIIRQMTGQYRCKTDHLRKLRDLARAIIDQDLRHPVELIWVPRDRNEESDRLSQVAFAAAMEEPGWTTRRVSKPETIEELGLLLEWKRK